MQNASMQNSTYSLPIVTNLTVVHSDVFIVVLLHQASGIRHLASGFSSDFNKKPRLYVEAWVADRVRTGDP